MNSCILPDCSHCPVFTGSVFGCSPATALVELGETRESRRYGSEETIFVEGTPVTGAYCLCSGSAILRKRDASGIEHDVARVGPGSLIGFRNPIEPGSYCVSAVAHTDVTVCFIPIDEMISLVRHNPTILFRLLESFCQRIGELRSKAA
jgi:CRP-like cAMP-binding protein